MADINSRLPTQDQADGATGSATPSEAILVGGTDGTNLRAINVIPASTAASASNAAVVVALSPNSPLINGYANYTSTISSTGNLFSQTNLLGYNSIMFALTGTWVASVQCQASNDGTTYFVVPFSSMTNLTQGQITTATVNDYYYLPITFQWLKIVVTAYTSGTISFNGYVSGSTIRPEVPDKVQLQDNSGNSVLSINNQLETRDVLNVSSQYRAQSVTTSAAEALGGSTILANRKLLHFTPTNGTLYWGYDSSVTTSTGSPVFPNNTVFLSVTNNVHVYVISATTTDVRIGEVS